MEQLPKASSHRLVSIDAFRAVIMLLMIFVNDLWTLSGIPSWLEHASADANHMGLADVVFPAFLFIVGLSVPFAIASRKKKGDSDFTIFMHILWRSVALLLMGFFQVNMDIYQETATLSKPVWQIFVTIGFFLVWLDYSVYQPQWAKILKTLGVLTLLAMALLFKSQEAVGIMAMKTQWWGILGLIGWTYLLSSCIFLFSGGKLWAQFAAFVFFLLFNVAEHLGSLQGLGWVRTYLWLAESGAIQAMTMAGILTSLVYSKYKSSSSMFWIILAGFSTVLLLLGYFTHPLWGISKIRATPSWASICAAISIICFGLMVSLTEILKQDKWYGLIKPAGTSTLTCYLLPYIHYALLGLLSIPQLPLALRSGVPGMLKSLLYALLIIVITGCLEKRKIRLKI